MLKHQVALAHAQKECLQNMLPYLKSGLVKNIISCLCYKFVFHLFV